MSNYTQLLRYAFLFPQTISPDQVLSCHRKSQKPIRQTAKVRLSNFHLPILVFSLRYAALRLNCDLRRNTYMVYGVCVWPWKTILHFECQCLSSNKYICIVIARILYILYKYVLHSKWGISLSISAVSYMRCQNIMIYGTVCGQIRHVNVSFASMTLLLLFPSCTPFDHALNLDRSIQCYFAVFKI